MSARNRIYFIGFSGAGKSAVGRRTAQLLGWAFADADERIVARAGKPVERIFAEDGEPAFRALERAVIAEFAGEERVVVAFRLGSFQPLEKWLRDRVGRPLAHNDQQRYMRMAAALRDTVRVMGEIDAAIAAHGGLWGERDSIEGEA